MSADNFGALGADFFIKTFNKGSLMSQSDLDQLIQYVQLTTTIMAVGEFTPGVQNSVWMILERVDVPSAPGYTVTNNTDVTMTSSGMVTIDSIPWTKVTDKPALFSGAYADLTGKPAAQILQAPQWNTLHNLGTGNRYLVGDLVFNAGTIYQAIADNESQFTAVGDATYWRNLGTGIRLQTDYLDLANKPTIPTSFGSLVNGDYTVSLSTTGQLNLPSAANAEGNNARIQSTNSIDILSNLVKWTFSTTGDLTLPTGGDIKDSTGASVLGGGFSGAYADLTGKPTIFDGNYNSLTNKPTYRIAVTGSTGGPFGSNLQADSLALAGLNPTENIPSTYGGDLILQGGVGGANNDLYGEVRIKSGTIGANYEWHFTTDKKIKLPAGGSIVDSTGTSVLGGSGSYAPAVPTNWASPAPTTIAEALNRIAAKLLTLGGDLP